MMQNNLISQLHTNIQQSQDSLCDYLVIEIDNKKYALCASKVLEIVKLIKLDHPEGMLSCILGVMHFKKEPISILDLRSIFKKERISYGISTKVIIIQTDTIKIAIACDQVADIKKIKKDEILPVMYQQESEFFEGLYSRDNNDIYIINIEKITNFISKNPQLFPSSPSKYIDSDKKSEEIFESRKKTLIELDNSVQPNISLYDSGVSFSINNAKYYINMASVKEFYKVNNSKFIKVPCTKDYIFGLINIKGEYITVVDIRSLYSNSKTTIKEKSTIIILNSEEFKIGILADKICESINVNFDEIVQSKLQKNDENKMIEFVKNDEIYQVIDIDQMLKDERLTVC